MFVSSLQHVFASPHTRLNIAVNECDQLWSPDNARLTECGLLCMSALTLVIISLIALVSIVKYATNKPLRQGWNPLPSSEELSNDEESDPLDRDQPSLLWSIALGVLAVLGCAMQVAQAGRALSLRPPAALCLLSWILLLLLITLERPRYCQASLLLFYLAALATEAAKPNSWTFTTLDTLFITSNGTMLSSMISVAIVLCMQLRPVAHSSAVAHPSEFIGTHGFAPSSMERSPEDSLRLWQFLTFSWVWPLLAVGKERQIDQQDVWARAYELRNEYVAKTRSGLGHLPLVRKLLTENAVDGSILVVLSLVSLSCEMASALLLQQLLLAMKSSAQHKDRVIVYAILILARGLLSAQVTVLHAWYSRRCFERTSSELIISIHEKTMSRIINSSSEGGLTQFGALKSSSNPRTKPRSEYSEPKKWVILTQLWNEMRSSRKTDSVKPAAVSASSGQILNLVRSDTYEISQLFGSIGRLIRAPFGVVSTILVLWHLLGPWSLFGVVVILIGLVLNSLLVRLRLRQQRRSKIAGDLRVHLNSEFVDVIRHLRWYAWVEPWLAKVMSARQGELNARFVTAFLNVVSSFIMLLAGSFMPIVAFFAYTAIGNQPLTIDLIFPALQLFTSLQFKMFEIPSLFTQLMSAFVAFDRIEALMNEPDRKAHENPIKLVNPKLTLQDCSFAWPGKVETVIKNASLVFLPGLTIVYGPVGSGKTALIQALLNEMDIRSGQCVLPDEPIGYCPQTSWLRSVSIRDNILFYSPYEEDRYRKVLEACVLNPDLAQMEQGDLSQIGEGGIGLSGGQRARVALARALYSRAKILLLDDPLSALDHRTGESLVKNCFAGDLISGRTVVMVTHQPTLVHQFATQFVQVSDGRARSSTIDPFETDAAQDREPYSESVSPHIRSQDRGAKPVANQLIREEGRQQGNIRMRVWLTFALAAKYWWLLVIAIMILNRALDIVQQWFFKSWGESYEQSAPSRTADPTWHQHGRESLHASSDVKTFFSLDPIDYFPSPKDDLRPWLIALLFLGLSRTASLFVYSVSQLMAIYVTSRSLFAQAIDSIAYAVFQFYDATPAGRIMNRLTKDIQSLDDTMRYFGGLLFAIGLLLSSALVVGAASPILLVFLMVLTIAIVFIFLQFLPGSRSLKRLENVSMSPVFSAFGEINKGLTTIRAFRMERHFQHDLFSTLDHYQNMGHMYLAVSNWLAFRYECMATLSAFGITVIALLTNLSPGMTAFILLNSTHFIQSIDMLCISFGKLQTEFVAVERIVELMDVEKESKGTQQPPASWPTLGSSISFRNVTARYPSRSEPALRDICLDIPGGRTIAIVGRNGSGKSTLAMTLLGVLRPETGQITIDNLSISNLDVTSLRRRVTFIAQDPVMFSGTVRENLDPLGEFSDEECQAALERVTAGTSQVAWSLRREIEPSGKNLSQGERQLMGITRAVLRRSAIVILDEATSSVDLTTSMELQSIIRKELTGTTLLVIAHRPETIREAEYYVMLENGRVTKQGAVEGTTRVQ